MYDKPLKCGKDGTFRILVFTDIHEKPDIESEKGRLKSEDTFLFMNTALDVLQPDLVVLGGDNCTDFDSKENIDGFYPIFNRVTKPMIEREIPFAAVLGNHEHDIDEKWLDIILDAYRKCPFSLACNENDSPHGKLDYHLTVKDASGEKDVFNLWMMDSNNTVQVNDRIVYDCVHSDQIEWYEKQAAVLKEKNGGQVLPAILFQHIPVPEIYGTLRAPKWYELPVCVKGHDTLEKYLYVKNASCTGYLGEGPDIPFYNEGQFAAWKRTGDVIGAFFGHDHMNDFHGTFDGITMGQSKTGGFRAYTDGCRTGARLIELDEKDLRHFRTQMIHFKELGLQCRSLGPVEKRITDRQSLTLHTLKWIGAGAAAAAGMALFIKKLLK